MCSMRCTIHKAHKFAHNCAHKSAQFTKLINICLVCYILGPSSQGYDFSSGHVWMREFDCEEGCAPKN